MLENRKRAQGLTEYGLILALVAFVALAALVSFGGTLSGNVGSAFSQVANALRP
jgi:Flp pilus assembly pilin Flp